MNYISNFQDYIILENFATFIEKNRNNIEFLYSFLNKAERLIGKIIKIAVYLTVIGGASAGMVWLIGYHLNPELRKKYEENLHKSKTKPSAMMSAGLLDESLNENALVDLKTANILSQNEVMNKRIMDKVIQNSHILNDYISIIESPIIDKNKIKTLSQKIDNTLDDEEKKYTLVTWENIIKSFKIFL